MKHQRNLLTARAMAAPLALDRHRGLRLSAARRRADVRPGALAGPVVVQDAGRAARVSAVASAHVAEGGRRARAAAAAAALHA